MTLMSDDSLTGRWGDFGMFRVLSLMFSVIFFSSFTSPARLLIDVYR